MYIVALTGGIGSGKSEAAKQFVKLGIPVVDTDVIAHTLTAAGEPALVEIQHIFGSSFLNTDGSLDRKKLRTCIFSNAEERLKLEGLLHPLIHDCALMELAHNENLWHPAYQILVVPLLFESDHYKSDVNKTVVIDCDENLQIKRTMARSQLTELEVKAMIDAQTPRTMRLKLADEIIENNGSVAELSVKINKLHKKLIKTCIVSK